MKREKKKVHWRFPSPREIPFSQNSLFVAGEVERRGFIRDRCSSALTRFSPGLLLALSLLPHLLLQGPGVVQPVNRAVVLS